MTASRPDAGIEIEVFSSDRAPETAVETSVTNLYVDSFPESERSDPGSLFDLDPGHLLLTANRGSRLLGFASVRALAEVRTALLAYIAVDPTTRSQGVGRLLLDQVARSAEAMGLQGIVLEIEDPETPGAGPDARRRPAFYRRWGARDLPCLERYYMPSFAEPDRLLPMQLLYRPLDDRLPQGDDLRRLLTALYESEYRAWADDLLPDLLDGVVC